MLGIPSLALCIRETPKRVLLQTVKTQLKCNVQNYLIAGICYMDPYAYLTNCAAEKQIHLINILKSEQIKVL